jgi:hypothetical protein
MGSVHPVGARHVKELLVALSAVAVVLVGHWAVRVPLLHMMDEYEGVYPAAQSGVHMVEDCSEPPLPQAMELATVGSVQLLAPRHEKALPLPLGPPERVRSLQV